MTFVLAPSKASAGLNPEPRQRVEHSIPATLEFFGLKNAR
jgi:hypothetical protein